MSNNVIGEAAIACAWPKGTSEKKYNYHGGQPYGDFKKAINKSFPERKGAWSKQCQRGASCDVFVGTMIRYTGVDKKMERGLGEIDDRIAGSSKWKRIGSGTPLKGGDVQVLGGQHVRLVVELKSGKYIAEANHNYKGGQYAHISGKAYKGGGYRTYRSKIAPEATGEFALGGAKTTTTTKTTTTETTTKGYKEYYSTKPQDIEDIQDTTKVNNNPVLTRSIRVLTLEEDQDRLKSFYPSASVNNLTQTYELNPATLIVKYNGLINILTKLLTEVQKPQINEYYITFFNTGTSLGIADIIQYKNDFKYTCYALPANMDATQWIDLYNNFYIKKNSLSCYQESKKNYQSTLNTNSFIKNLYNEQCKSYSQRISNYYNQMQTYVKENTQEIKLADKITAINRSINNSQIKINKIKNQLNAIDPNITELNKQKTNIEKLKKNLEELFKNFKRLNFSDNYTYWNKSIVQNPSLLNFWLEFLDNNSDISKLSVKNIGVRTLVKENSGIRSIYFKNIPNIIYYENEDIQKSKQGYIYLKISNLNSIFSDSAQGISAKDEIDNLLYQHTYGAEEINLNSLPIYYLEPNVKILVYDKINKINDIYILNKINQSLNINNFNMSLTANKTVKRLY